MGIRFTNVRQFEKELNQFVNKTGIAPGQVAQKLTFDVFSGVVKKTPVDTGWARANWIFTEDQPSTQLKPKPSENNVLPEPQTPNIQSRKFPIYWIANNVPYIIHLENGHSKQMGKGYMVRRTIAAIRSNIKALLRDL